jgi:hypothetical protein
MKKIIYIFTLLLLGTSLHSQTIVSTQPENKNAILEEFTGTGCPNCPGGHTAAATLLTANPGDLFVIANHPTNSSYTTGDPMANAFSNAFYTNPFISPSNRYMPSAMINRRVWSTERILGVGNWTANVATILAESSPLNVGVSSSYNTGTKILTVNVEVYFTADVTNSLTLYTLITEDGIVATQSGGTSNYVHNHVFRAALPGPTPQQWGEAIATPTTTGTTKTITYTYDNSTTNYDMTQCEIVAFVRDASNEEIVSGNGASVGSSSFGIQDKLNSIQSVAVYPNPVSASSVLQVGLDNSSNVSFEITDISGRVVMQENAGMLSAGLHSFNLNMEAFEKGLYLINVHNETSTYTLKIVK